MEPVRDQTGVEIDQGEGQQDADQDQITEKAEAKSVPEESGIEQSAHE